MKLRDTSFLVAAPQDVNGKQHHIECVNTQTGRSFTIKFDGEITAGEADNLAAFISEMINDNY